MQVTIEKLLQLPSLRQATVVAGAQGLDQIVDSISVLEYAEPTDLQENFFDSNEFSGNEIAISGFIHIKDDVEAQLRTIMRMHKIGEVGIILYYVGIFMPEIDQRLIDLADQIGFTIICMPKNCLTLKYSEVIYEVVEIIVKNKLQNPFFVSEMLERISKLSEHQRSLDVVLRFISDHLTSAIYLIDDKFNIMNQANWPAVSAITVEDIQRRVQKKGLSLPQNAIRFSDLNDISICSKPIESENAIPLQLLMVKENGDLTDDFCDQAAEVVQLFINIWSKGHGSIGIDELVKAILNDEPMKMRRLAEILKIDIKSVHHFMVLKPKETQNSSDQVHKIYETWQVILSDVIKQYYHIFFCGIYHDNLIIFLGDEKLTKAREAVVEALTTALSIHSDHSFTLVTSYGHNNTLEVRQSFIMCMKYLEYAKIIMPNKVTFTQSELGFAKSCHQIIQYGEEGITDSLKILEPLFEASYSRDALYETLSTYLLDAESSVAMTADLLFIHRNTIKYRIGRIQEVLKMDIRKMPEHFMVYQAVAVKRLLEDQM